MQNSHHQWSLNPSSNRLMENFLMDEADLNGGNMEMNREIKQFETFILFRCVWAGKFAATTKSSCTLFSSARPQWTWMHAWKRVPFFPCDKGLGSSLLGPSHRALHSFTFWVNVATAVVWREIAFLWISKVIFIYC